MKWHDAEAACKENGGHLVSIQVNPLKKKKKNTSFPVNVYLTKYWVLYATIVVSCPFSIIHLPAY